ncbi:ammonia channel protein [Thermodesulfatator autotrophicus]|uniref:Ammonium transporter n=1 Tax=Thermodesulfatator autotrophicus TaxID=1795632 RepID=A0A177E5N0_9BACT|nr:ammonia channel protein [Thermodesulfatator autotrophicus]
MNAADTAFLLISAGLVLLMTPALSVFYGGLVRRKNILGTIMQSLICITVVTFLWIYLGYSLAFGPDIKGIIGGLKYIALRGVGQNPSPDYASTVPHIVFMIYQCMFAIITPALITGAFAERMRFKSFLLFAVLWSILVYSPVCHWIWGGGWLARLGVLDFAGGLVVHLTCGVAALVTAIVVGPRRGFRREAFMPHNLPLTVIGTGLLWFGWFGFNGGSALAVNGIAAQAFVNTHIAGAMGLGSWLILEWIHQKKPTTLGACSGAIAGLATITPAAGFVNIHAAVFIGLLAGAICYLAVLFKNRAGYDDSLDVVGIHGVGGLLGTLCLGLLATKAVNPDGANGLLFGGLSFFISQLIGILAVGIYTFVITWIITKFVDFIMGLRVEPEEEVAGLDVSEHGETAYNI